MLSLQYIWQMMKKISKLPKSIREFLSNAKPKKLNLKKKSVKNIAMALLKEREMVHSAFESRILLLLSQLSTNQSEQSEQSK